MARPTAKSANDRGLRYFANGEWKNALEQFRIAERLNAADRSIQYNIGLTLFQMGRYEECLEPLRAAGSDPAMTDESRYLRGIALCRTGALARSAQELEPLRAKPKHSEEALYLLSSAIWTLITVPLPGGRAGDWSAIPWAATAPAVLA